MGRQKFTEVGYINKAHGIKGEVKIILHQVPRLSALLKFRSLHIGTEKDLLPYFIQNLSDTSKGDFILQLEDCDNRSRAEKLIGQKIFVPNAKIDELFDADKDDFGWMIGFSAFENNGNAIGEIQDVFKFPQHSLAQIFISGKEILLPLNEDTIIKANKRKKLVTLQLPDGIFDI